MPLNRKQSLFVLEYLKDLNATQAYIRAGYSPQGARQGAERLLSNVDVKAAVDAALAERSKRVGITADRVLQEYARIAFADIRSMVNFGPNGIDIHYADDLTEDDAAAIAEVTEVVTEHGGTRKVKLHDKVRALDMLAKHLGLATEKVDHAVTVKVLEISEDDDEE